MGTPLFLGEHVDPAAHARNGTRFELDADDLTTHGVIVGMTGSGKTGLGVVLIEEALRAGIPALVIDPKGDMTNLALRFPGLSADEFAPWTPPGTDPAATATLWSEGLASWGLGGADIGALDTASGVTVYTPGSSAGVALDVVGSLARPAVAATDLEVLHDEIEGVVSGLLGLVGIDADPLSSREHILLSTIVAHAWSAGADLDLGRLVQQVQDPPVRKLGVLELESFYPAADRTALATKLNGLLASPSFASWSGGAPMDMERLLSTDGGAACSVVYLAHLSEEERQFVVSLLLSKLVTWMRAQSGRPDLRALVYMDEVFGYVPPTAAPPAKKPILTLLKQARAFGVGVVLSTQNPVDLDYKALSNAGTWMIGRLQTERDLARLSEGLTAAAGSVDVGAVSETIAGLAEREFVVHTTSGAAPATVTSRWALDYLAGPLTRDQLADLPGQPPAPPHPTSSGSGNREPGGGSPTQNEVEAVAPASTDADSLATVPRSAGAAVRFADPAAPWIAEVGGDPASTRHRAGLAARVELLFDDTKADLRHVEEFECVLLGLAPEIDADGFVPVDYDDRDLRETPPEGATFEITDAPITDERWFADARKALVDRLQRERTMTVLTNRDLKLWSRPGEAPEAFAARCAAAADERTDAEAAKIRARLEAKMGTVQRAIEREEIRVAELRARASDTKQHEVVSAAGDILGSLLGGRRSARSILSKAKGVSSRRKQSSAAADRVESALAKVEQKQLELADLEAELADALADIAAEWDAVAADVVETEVPLEKTDVSVAALALVWVPA
jgi:hypothetical protein